MSTSSPFEVVGELTYDLATDILSRVAFTEGAVTNPRLSAQRRPLTPHEKLVIGEGFSQVPLNDPILPERVIRALLTIAGTRHNLDAHDRAIDQLCAHHTRYGDGS